MTRPAKWQTASAEELYEWAKDHDAYRWRDTFAALRDEVAREVREERASEVIGMRDTIDALRAAVRRAEDDAFKVIAEREDWKQKAAESRETIRVLTQRVNDAEAALREAVADAKRQGAWDALTKLAAETWTHVRCGVWKYTLDVLLLKHRDTHYAPAAPQRVELGEWVVTWNAPNYRAQMGGVVKYSALAADLAHILCVRINNDQLAALLALREESK